MFEKIKNASRKQKIIGGIVMVLILVGSILVFEKERSYVKQNQVLTSEEEKEDKGLGIPTLSLSHENININNQDIFDVDVILSHLPDNIYPAASIKVGFDNSKLEFIGIEKGTVKTYGNSSDGFSIPTWNCDVESSNNSSEINAIYVDMTAGRFAYNKEGFEKGSKGLIIKLKLKLKEGLKVGEITKLDLRDAVFATVNGDKDNTSLSSIKGSLEINGCDIMFDSDN